MARVWAANLSHVPAFAEHTLRLRQLPLLSHILGILWLGFTLGAHQVRTVRVAFHFQGHLEYWQTRAAPHIMLGASSTSGPGMSLEATLLVRS